MDQNNQNADNAGNNLEPLPIQPRQPQNLQGLLRFAMEARQEDPEPVQELVPMDNERRQFLAEALQNMVMDPIVVLRTSIPVLTDAQKISSLDGKEEITPEIKAVFVSVLDVVEDLDVANDFCKLGGFDAFPLCYNTKNPELWVYANNLLAGVCQNFPQGQALALERGLLQKQLELLRHPDTKHKEKFVYALSCCVREFGPGCRALAAAGGCEALAALLAEEPRLQSKAACLLRHLLHNLPETRERITALNPLQYIVPQLDQPINQATEHLLHLLRTYIDPQVPEQCKSPALNLKRVLNRILTAPEVVDDPEQYAEIVTYCTEINALVFGEDVDVAYDSEEEPDR